MIKQLNLSANPFGTAGTFNNFEFDKAVNLQGDYHVVSKVTNVAGNKNCSTFRFKMREVSVRLFADFYTTRQQ